MGFLDETGLTYLCSIIKASLTKNLQLAYPIGAVFLSATEADPSSIFGFGTWEYTGTLAMVDSEATSHEIHMWKRTA